MANTTYFEYFGERFQRENCDVIQTNKQYEKVTPDDIYEGVDHEGSTPFTFEFEGKRILAGVTKIHINQYENLIFTDEFKDETARIVISRLFGKLEYDLFLKIQNAKMQNFKKLFFAASAFKINF